MLGVQAAGRTRAAMAFGLTCWAPLVGLFQAAEPSWPPIPNGMPVGAAPVPELPAGPVGPVGPVAPATPAAPVAPAGPWVPCGPGAPLQTYRVSAAFTSAASSV